MTLAFKRYQRRRIIAKRVKRAAWCWWKVPEGGYLAKNNTVCSCGMCRDEKYRDKPREKGVNLDDWL